MCGWVQCYPRHRSTKMILDDTATVAVEMSAHCAAWPFWYHRQVDCFRVYLERTLIDDSLESCCQMFVPTSMLTWSCSWDSSRWGLYLLISGTTNSTEGRPTVYYLNFLLDWHNIASLQPSALILFMYLDETLECSWYHIWGQFKCYQ